jgi:hypothetical protein
MASHKDGFSYLELIHAATKRSFFGVFSLCLSRACLGKMFVLNVNDIAKRRRFFYSPVLRVSMPEVVRDRCTDTDPAHRHACHSFQTSQRFLCFVCPEPVLANIRFGFWYTHGAEKKAVPAPRVSVLCREGLLQGVDCEPFHGRVHWDSKKTPLSLFECCFPYVCPEPVLVN